MQLCNQPSGGVLERPRSGLLDVDDLCLTPPSPCPPCGLVRWCCPAPPGGTWEARLTAPPLARAPGGTARNRCRTEEEGGSARWWRGPRPPLQYPGTSGGRLAYALQEAPGSLTVLWMASGPVCGRPHDEPRAEREATAQVCLAVRLTLPDPAPALRPWRGANALAGLLPALRCPRPVFSRLGGLARCAPSPRLPHSILLVAQADDGRGGAAIA
jgi:hypothetical protein